MAVPISVAAVPGIPVRSSGMDGLAGVLAAMPPGQKSELGPKKSGPVYYEDILPGNCGPEYFSKLWEEEFVSDLRQDAYGTALDHHRKFGLGKARIGGRINLSLVDAPEKLIDEGHGAYFRYRLTTPHQDGGDNPLENLPEYWDRSEFKKVKKPVPLVAGGLEHIHLMPGDLKEEVAHEKAHAKAEGWIHAQKKQPIQLEARLESGAHLPPEGYVARVVVSHLLEGRTLGVEIHGTTVTRITNKKAREFGWLERDQIMKVNGRIVSNNLEFQQKMEHAENVLRMSGRPVIFEVWRSVQHSLGGRQAEMPFGCLALPISPVGSPVGSYVAPPAPLSLATPGLRSVGPPHPLDSNLGPDAEAQMAALAHENAALRSRLDAELWNHQFEGMMHPMGPAVANMGFPVGIPPASAGPMGPSAASLALPMGPPPSNMVQALPLDAPPIGPPLAMMGQLTGPTVENMALPVGPPHAHMVQAMGPAAASMALPMGAPPMGPPLAMVGQPSGPAVENMVLPMGPPPASIGQSMGLGVASMPMGPSSMALSMSPPPANMPQPMGLAAANMVRPISPGAAGMPLGTSPASMGQPMGPRLQAWQ